MEWMDGADLSDVFQSERDNQGNITKGNSLYSVSFWNEKSDCMYASIVAICSLRYENEQNIYFWNVAKIYGFFQWIDVISE